MKILLSILLNISLVFGNGIDDGCPALTYKSAPIVNADQYLCRKEYAIAYSYKSKNPIYSTEFLTKSHIGTIPRTNDFRADRDIPVKYQAVPKDYVKSICHGGRCDKGHVTPDQDFSSCQICTSESFLMSNMVPQNFQNNEIIWKSLESRIRTYVNKGNSVFIMTGPVYEGVPTYIGNSVQVPSSLFKMVINKKTGKSIAFLMKNINIPVADLPNLVVNIASIEQVTGITFEKSLDKKTTGIYSDWFNK